MASDESTADDIITVCARFVHGLRMLDIKDPAVILLTSHEDGMRMVMEIAHKDCLMLDYEAPYGELVEVGGELFREIQVYGLKIRWPAMPIVTPRGPRYA